MQWMALVGEQFRNFRLSGRSDASVPIGQRLHTASEVVLWLVWLAKVFADLSKSVVKKSLSRFSRWAGQMNATQFIARLLPL
jgi:hypothetical protein